MHARTSLLATQALAFIAQQEPEIVFSALLVAAALSIDKSINKTEFVVFGCGHGMNWR
jgi:hypothetical protein